MALLYGIVAAMQVCWLGTALDLANQKAADGFLSILVVLGFYPLAFWLPPAPSGLTLVQGGLTELYGLGSRDASFGENPIF